MSDKAPVYTLASDCNDLFQACWTPARNAGTSMENLLEEYERRFVAWWQSLNDSTSNEMSLDLKLQNHSTIRDILLRLLIILQMNLNQLQQDLRSQAGHSYLNAYDSNTGESDLLKTEWTSAIPEKIEGTLEAIEDALKELSHFSAAMRETKKNSETKQALAFAANYYDSTHFERMAFLAIETLYPDASETLQLQLSKSMSDRNLRLNYRAFRHGKRSFQRSSGSPGPHQNDSLAKDAANSGASHKSIPEADFLGNPTYTAGHQHLNTAPTSLNTHNFNLNLAIAHQSKSRSGVSTAVVSSSEPSPPDFAGRDNIQCKWCFSLISKSFVKDGKWTPSGRKHYLSDLEPYVCISEECSESLPTFSSTRKWKAHMESHNDVWGCSIDHLESGVSSSSVGPLHKQFQVMHYNSHGQADAKSDGGTVANSSRAIDETCPICGHSIDPQDVRAVGQSSPTNDDSKSMPLKRSLKQQFRAITKYFKMSEATESKGKTQSPDVQDDQVVTAAMENHVLSHLEFLMVLSLKLGDNEYAGSGSDHEDDKSKTVEVSHGSYSAEHLDKKSIEDMSSLRFGSPPRPSSVTTSEDNESPETDSIWSDVFTKTHSGFPQSIDEDKILTNIQRQRQISENLKKQSASSSTNEDKISKKPEKQAKSTGVWVYQWDYIPSYRLDQKGLVKYLHEIFTAESHRKRIKYETFDEDHYRVWIPRQLTKEEKSDWCLEKHRWAKRDDNPFAY